MKNKNILIKIWGSLLAPKNSQKKYFEVIKFLSEIIKKFPDRNFFIINWSWNIWHSFVENNILNEKNILILQENLKNFFSEIDKNFLENWIKISRFETNKIYENRGNFQDFENFPKISILWWDILKNGKIISSDKIFWDFIDFFEKKWELFSWYFIWDTDWVYDENWKTILELSIKDDFEKINFKEKKWDVTWWMKNKFLELFWKKFNEIIIFNWSVKDNWNNIFFEKKIKNFTILKI